MTSWLMATLKTDFGAQIGSAEPISVLESRTSLYPPLEMWRLSGCCGLQLSSHIPCWHALATSVPGHEDLHIAKYLDLGRYRELFPGY